MSGMRGAARLGKIKLKVKLVVYRPGFRDRYFWTTLFIGDEVLDLSARLSKKFLNRFPTGYVYPVKVKVER